jgi:GNAT superfamily N-acetyltransferase
LRPPRKIDAVDDVVLRPASADEAPAISELALRSKAHWGYDIEFLAACRAELTIRPEWCDGRGLIVAEKQGRLVGFHRLTGDAPDGVLEALFVDEPAIGTGLGRRLLADAIERARGLGFTSLLIDADPGAAPFYRHMGAQLVGESPSGSVPGRMLPQLRLAV